MKKILKKKIYIYIFFVNLGAKADPRYKRTHVITGRVVMGLTCNDKDGPN